VEHWRNAHQQITIGLIVAAKRSLINPHWFLAAYQLPTRSEVPPDEAGSQPFHFLAVPTYICPSSAPPGYDLLYMEYNSYNNQLIRRKNEVQEEMKPRLFEMFPSLKNQSEWIAPYVVSCRTYAHTVGYSKLHDVQVPGIDGMYLCGDQVAGYGEAGKNGITRAFSSALKCANRIRGAAGLPELRPPVLSPAPKM
jgi:hypothetical protein